LGEVTELTRRWQEWLQDARERGDRYAATNLSTYIMSIAQLAADRPEEARRTLLEIIGQWSHRGFHVQHHNAMLARVYIDLYLGNGNSAFAYVEEKWPAYKDSLLLRVQQVRIDALQSHARSALAVAVSAADPQVFLFAAERDARQLEQQGVAWSTAYARLIRAGVAAVRGDAVRALTLLADAATRFEGADMHICAAAARRRLGQLKGGDAGGALVKQTDAWMMGQGIKNPARMAAMHTPGFSD
jgi:hypothetical protein